MISFLLALQFLTVVPLNIVYVDDKKIARSAAYFPLVGLLLGLILSGENILLLSLDMGNIPANIVLVVSLIILTGGLHLDGLADTSDAFLSRKNQEEILTIMRDAHIGVMGVLSIICIILLKIAFLSSLDPSLKATSLILTCVLSRWGLVFAMYFFKYARQDGKAKIFFQGMNLRIFICATSIALLCVVAIWRIKGLIIFAIVVTSICLVAKSISDKIGGITGDTLGALNELSEAIILFSILIMQRVYSWNI